MNDAPETPRLNFGSTTAETQTEENFTAEQEATSEATVEFNPVTEGEAVAETQEIETDNAVVAEAPYVESTDVGASVEEVVAASDADDDASAQAAESDVDLTPYAGDTFVAAEDDGTEDDQRHAAEAGGYDADDEAAVERPIGRTVETDTSTSTEASTGSEEVPLELAETSTSTTSETAEVVDQSTSGTESDGSTLNSGQQNLEDTETVEEAQAELQASQDKLAEVSADDATDVIAEPVGDSVAALKAQKEDIERQIADKQNAEKQSVLSQIKTVVENFNIPVEELLTFLGGLPSKRKGVKAPIKYRDTATGNEWSGRGKAPSWIKDQDRSKFLIV